MNSGPVEFYLPWTDTQHLNKFTGYYEKQGVTYEKDIFFGAKIGSKLKFINSDNELEAELEKTTEGIQKNV
jgi:hypothetical protein